MVQFKSYYEFISDFTRLLWRGSNILCVFGKFCMLNDLLDISLSANLICHNDTRYLLPDLISRFAFLLAGFQLFQARIKHFFFVIKFKVYTHISSYVIQL